MTNTPTPAKAAKAARDKQTVTPLPKKRTAPKKEAVKKEAVKPKGEVVALAARRPAEPKAPKAPTRRVRLYRDGRALSMSVRWSHLAFRLPKREDGSRWTTETLSEWMLAEHGLADWREPFGPLTLPTGGTVEARCEG